MFSEGVTAAMRSSSGSDAVLKSPDPSTFAPVTGKRSPPHLPGENDTGSSVRFGSSRERKNIDETSWAGHGDDARIADRAEHRHRLILVFGEIERDLGRVDIAAEFRTQGVLELIDGETARLNSADHGEINKTIWVDPNGFIAELFHINDTDRDLVPGPKCVLIREGRLARNQGLLGRRARRPKVEDKRQSGDAIWAEKQHNPLERTWHIRTRETVHPGNVIQPRTVNTNRSHIRSTYPAATNYLGVPRTSETQVRYFCSRGKLWSTYRPKILEGCVAVLLPRGTFARNTSARDAQKQRIRFHLAFTRHT